MASTVKMKKKMMMKSSHGLPYGFLLLLIVVANCVNPSSSQFNYPQNVETYYPYESPPPLPAEPPAPPPAERPVDADPPEAAAPIPVSTAVILPPAPVRPPRSSKKAIMTAVGATAASAFVLAAVFFLLFTRYKSRRRVATVNEGGGGSGGTPPAAAVVAGSRSEFVRFDGKVKGLIVDEDGLDVLYWKKLRSNSGSFRKETLDRGKNGKIPRGKSSSSQNQIYNDRGSVQRGRSIVGSSGDGGGSKSVQLMAVPKAPAPEKQAAPVVPKAPTPPPPPEKNAAPAPPPPPPMKKAAAPPPPPPMKPPAALPGSADGSESGDDQVKLKPLHWEKVNINRDHSMVWDKVERGSFQYNGDMMEALFGVVAANRRSPNGESTSSNTVQASNPRTRIFILDPKKSQNTAIVLKSLGIPRAELIDSLLQGKGLAAETLDKLIRAAPTKEEESQILAFDGDPSDLADAEFFLYILLKAVPSAFTRANEMLFRLTFDSEIIVFKESLQALEAACDELRNRGVFLKLLEAILKAGNRLNAGTARGNAKAFNLTTLRKLSDYKSSDGKTTLLHFVVHEVVRNEGRRCVLARNNSIGRQNANPSPQLDDQAKKQEREKEFLKLGLPIVGGLSSEFMNVKKAANIDYETLTSDLASLTKRINEIRGFQESDRVEIKAAEEENARVMDLVKKTTEYYQARGANEKNPLQLFVIVKDFLSMVDQTCVEIARSLQQKKTARTESGSGSGSSEEDVLRTRVTFPRLPAHFLSDKSNSGSDDDP